MFESGGMLLADPSKTPIRPLVDWPAPILVFPNGRKQPPAIILHMPDPIVPGDASPVKCVALVSPEDKPETLLGAVRICRRMQDTLLDSVSRNNTRPTGYWATIISSTPWRDAVAETLVPEVENALSENPELDAVLVLLVDTGKLAMTRQANAEIRRLRRLFPHVSLHMTLLGETD